MNKSIYNNKIRAAKRRIWQALKKDGIITEGVKHRKLITMFLNRNDFQRPIEMRWQDYIIKLYDNGDLGELEPKKKVEVKGVSEHKKKYLDYINSNEWKSFRARALDHFGNRCGLCDSDRDLHLHHKHYRNLFHETFADVIPLCRKCHKIHHKK